MKTELYNDNFQNFKKYNIPKAQLVIADIPYNLGVNAYASSTEWYIDGDNRNGESNKAGKAFFNTDVNFNIAEYMHFCNRLLKKEPKERGKAPARCPRRFTGMRLRKCLHRTRMRTRLDLKKSWQFETYREWEAGR